jgi:hypothetical protein
MDPRGDEDGDDGERKEGDVTERTRAEQENR